MQLVAKGTRQVRGTVMVPADKSILHRAFILAALACGQTRISYAAAGRDCESTRQALIRLGVSIRDAGDSAEGRRVAVVSGRGPENWREPEREIQCGNSGTTMRLLLGIVAGLPLFTVLTGDASLRRRPMGRVVAPLSLMGARITGRSKNTLAPLAVAGSKLNPVRYRSPVASAQVKSAVLLAGFLAEGETVVEEPIPSRDHTERMLGAMGADVAAREGMARIRGRGRLEALTLDVPGDISSAAFFLGAAAALDGSIVTVRAVGVNPTRCGFLRTLQRMGTQIEVEEQAIVAGEPVGTVTARGSGLRAVTVAPEDVPSIIDELPLLAVLATQAEGVTRVAGASELRVKESDRIACIVTELRKLGARVEEKSDGFEVDGPTPLSGTVVRSHGDHRLAMALSVAGLLAGGETVVQGAECAAVSFPGFERTLASLAAASGHTP